MKIASTMIVKNEADIIKNCLENTLSQCDKVLIADNGSDDETIEIASKFKEVEIYSFPGLYRHGEAHNMLIEKCSSYDWVVPIDADEMWHGIRNACSLAKTHTIVIPRIKHYMAARDDETFIAENFPYFKIEEIMKHPRLIFKPTNMGRSVCVDDGCHNNGIKDRSVTEAITINHFPKRSSNQYYKKIKHGYGSFIKRKTSDQVGRHWKPWYDAIDGGLFHEKFKMELNSNKNLLI
jgi:glycosyltransferase involved in cell wall biosynthesis